MWIISWKHMLWILNEALLMSTTSYVFVEKLEKIFIPPSYLKSLGDWVDGSRLDHKAPDSNLTGGGIQPMTIQHHNTEPFVIILPSSRYINDVERDIKHRTIIIIIPLIWSYEVSDAIENSVVCSILSGSSVCKGPLFGLLINKPLSVSGLMQLMICFLIFPINMSCWFFSQHAN